MKPVFPVDIGTAMIEGLASAWAGPESETFKRGINVLRKYVPFDGARWALVDGPLDVKVQPTFHIDGSIGLSDALCDEYITICDEDAFAAAVVAHSGVVLRWSAEGASVPPNIGNWIERHKLAHGAARCSHAAFSGQAFVVVLYRFRGALAFNDYEALAIDLLLKQLEMLWVKSLREVFNLKTALALSGTLLAKTDGELIYCGSEMAKQLAGIGWDQKGKVAPQILVELGSTGGRARAGKAWVVVSVEVDGFRAQLNSTDVAPSLPMRLLRVASLTCDGLSAKAIARDLGLSPATVRTYLREVYRELDVHNKLELNRVIKSTGAIATVTDRRIGSIP